MSIPEVAIIDYDVGNVLSVQRGLEHCGAKVTVTSDPEKIFAAKRVVLPGVGAFSNAMQALERLGLVAVIREVARQQTPLLGICLGMQLLLDESDEFGVTTGLGLIPGRVIAVPDHNIAGDKQKIPHIGWNELHASDPSERWSESILKDNKPGESVYFVHSFMAVTSNQKHRLAECKYGGHLISAVIKRDYITGCQFHPEKSGKVGLKILRNFLC
jgi:glutamine amidotransferase